MNTITLPTELPATFPSEFARPPKEIWRWYAWTRMRRTEPMRWIATCWKGDTKEQAEAKREQALMEDTDLILVLEHTEYIPNC